ncbi:type VI secretion system tube protein TssD [Marivirga tractuosa]|uniref:type VI secretion system tube protein TssD n=1 Tax=Marivirga tractuosa TaxID=1006 RepID=UPI0035CF0142
MKKQILIITVLSILFFSQAIAQSNQTNYKISMDLYEGPNSEKRSYQLENISYYFSTDYHTDSIADQKMDASVGLNCVISGKVDKFLLQWMARSPKYLSGEISIIDIFTNEVVRKINFEQARVGSQSGTYSKGSGYSYGSDFALLVKVLTIDGVNIIDDK